MRKVKINNQECQVDDLLEGYTIQRKPSSNIDYFGDNGTDVFIQFKNGSSYIYKNVRSSHIEEMQQVESLGRFVSVLSKNYNYVPVKKALVTLVVASPVQ